MAVRVTVLMPTRNAERFVGEALQSIADSSITKRTNLEILVLDACSTDRTQAIVREFEPLARLSARVDGGMYQALNRGLDEALGDVIGWLNADDLWDPEGPAAVFDALERDAALDFAYGDQAYRDLRNGMFTVVPNSDDALGALRRCELERADVGTLAMLWRRQAISEIRWDPSYRMLADYAFWIRVAMRAPSFRSVRVPVCAGTFRWHDGSMTWGGGHQEQVYLESLRVTDHFLGRADLAPEIRRYVEAKRRVTLADMIWWQAQQRRARDVLRYGRMLERLGGSWVSVVARRAGSALLRRALPRDAFTRARSIYKGMTI